MSEPTKVKEARYLQTWMYVAGLRKLGKVGLWLQKAIKWACGKITGHEWSKTERGYGGGPCVDTWCRWCNFFAQVPASEYFKDNPAFREMVSQIMGRGVPYGELKVIKKAQQATAEEGR